MDGFGMESLKLGHDTISLYPLLSTSPSPVSTASVQDLSLTTKPVLYEKLHLFLSALK